MNYKIVHTLHALIVYINVIQALAILPNLKEQLSKLRKNSLFHQIGDNYYVNKLLSKHPKSDTFDLRRSHHKKSHDRDDQGMFELLSKELQNEDFMKWLRERKSGGKEQIPQADMKQPLRSGVRKREKDRKKERNENRLKRFYPSFPYQLRGPIVNEIEQAYKNNTVMYNEALIDRDAYLLMKSGATDLYVTVIPNEVYYDIEKKCVNWLSSCSLRGLREELLNKITSP